MPRTLESAEMLLPAARADENPIQRALKAMRTHLRMDVAYVSEFVDGRSVFREVDAPGHEAMIKPGDSYSLDDVYCRHILEGRLPELIPDTSKEELSRNLPITAAAPIGSHMSVPIRLPDGTPYGMFCCLGFKPNPSLNARDLQVMKTVAELAAFEVNRDLKARKIGEEKKARIEGVLANDQLSIVYQPIWRVRENRVIGFECLSRFAVSPVRSPDRWFAEAADVGMNADLELLAIERALAALPAFRPDVYLSVNASPATTLDPRFVSIVGQTMPERVVVELTEHVPVVDYQAIHNVFRPLRERGLRIAVDDAGAGYSSLQHILQLRPDFIKLDSVLTRGIDKDPARRALASALIAFARETDSRIIAEGVETREELATLRALGVEKAQGYYLGKPTSVVEAVALLAQPAARVA